MTQTSSRGATAAEGSAGFDLTTHGVVVAAGILGGMTLAYLLAAERTELAFALLLTVPVAYLLLRAPHVVIPMWLVATPLVLLSEGPLRYLYWVFHRALPVVALAVVVVAALARVNPRRLPRLGWPEFAMGGYLVASLVSIAHTSSEIPSTTIELYDRVFIPMCLYLVVRLVQPDERDFRRILPAVVFLLMSQAVIGLLSWAAPDLLPSEWLGRAGTRTTGSLRHPNVYGTTILFAALVILHVALNGESRFRRQILLWVSFAVAASMVFLTYSRAAWLGAAVVVLGLFAIYPRFVGRFAVIVTLVVLPVISSGLMDEQLQFAQHRLGAQQSALSRLPVIKASIEMAEQRPLVGWGYGNFDRYSHQYQTRVGDFVVPDRFHSSHNLYLTILAEQGILGLVLYLAPALWWLARSRSAWRHMPVSGRKLLVTLWLVLAAHFVVNNYSNMRVVFGLGIWWLTLGMIAALVARYRPGAGRRSGPGGISDPRRDGTGPGAAGQTAYGQGTA